MLDFSLQSPSFPYPELRLITGFEPNNNGLNASEILVLSLQDKLPDVLSSSPYTLNFKIMPGDTDRLGLTLADVLKIDSPDI